MTDDGTVEAEEQDERQEPVMDREKKTIKYLITVPVLVVVAVIALTFFFSEKDGLERPKPLQVGDTALDFNYPDLEGNMISLSSYRGRVVFINIWATWCPTCVDEMPSMEKIYHQFERKDFEILAVSIDILGKQVVRPFMDKYSLTFPALLDKQGTIKRIYATTGVPESFILDREGKIAFIAIGPRDWTQSGFTRLIQNLIEGGEIG